MKFCIKHLKSIPGIYALFAAGVCLYVGKADCLFNRISFHVRKRNDFETIKVWDLNETIKTMNHEEAKAWLRWNETLTISKLDPVENTCRPDPNFDYIKTMPIKIQAMIINQLPSLS